MPVVTIKVKLIRSNKQERDAVRGAGSCVCELTNQRRLCVQDGQSVSDRGSGTERMTSVLHVLQDFINSRLH